MEFVVQEAAKKVLNETIKKARGLRQKQVRQQSMEWASERRKKFEEEKLHQKKLLAHQITLQVEDFARARIEHLLSAHDLALLEVGAAHRAAAQLREAEVWKIDKLREQQELADIRGNYAIRQTLQDRKRKVEIQNESVKRREQVRKAEDQKVKEMIELSRSRVEMGTHFKTSSINVMSKGSREPLTNSNQIIAPNEIVTKKDQNAGDRLSYPGKPLVSKSKPHFSTHKSRSKMGIENSRKRKIMPNIRDSNANEGIRSAFEETAKAKKNQYKSPGSILKSHTITRYTTNSTDAETSFQRRPVKRPKSTVQFNAKSSVRYFDTSIPQSETHYTPPEGLGKKEEAHDSPDAWSKATTLSTLSMKEVQDRAKRQEEWLRTSKTRGNNALKKEKLEKQLTRLKNQLLSSETEASSLGTGQQIALLGLDESPPPSGIDSRQISEISSDLERDDQTGISSKKTLSKFNVRGVMLNRKNTTPKSPKGRCKNDEENLLGSDMMAEDILMQIESDIIKLKEQEAELKAKKFYTGTEIESSSLDSNDNESFPNSYSTKESYEFLTPTPHRNMQLKKMDSSNGLFTSAQDENIKKSDFKNKTLERHGHTTTPEGGKMQSNSKSLAPNVPFTYPSPDGNMQLKKTNSRPRTSTPKEKIHLKKLDSKNISVSVSHKELILHQVISKFLTRRTESIDMLTESSSSSSNLRMDSMTFESIAESRSFFSASSTKSAAQKSVPETNSVASSKAWHTILSERIMAINSNSDTDSRDSLTGSKSTGKSHQTNSSKDGSTQESSGLSGSTQGSTIAEATVRTIIDSTSPSSASEEDKNASNGGEVSDQSKVGTTTSNDTDNSTLVKLKIRDETDNRDKISALQSKIETLIREAERGREPTSTETNSSDPTHDTTQNSFDRNGEEEKASLDASRLQEVIQSMSPLSGGVISSSGTSEDNQFKRSDLRQLHGDTGNPFLSPIEQERLHGDVEIVSSVFDELRNDFAGLMCIERPPWLL